MPPFLPVEICINCTDLDSTFRAVAAARQGGAQRVELCSHMEVDGLTPKVDRVAAARNAWGEGSSMLAMIRPRPGGFVYAAAEADTMADQIRAAAQGGADGVVLGAVRDRQLDGLLLARLVELARSCGLTVTCHRAFDAVDDPRAAMALLADLGVARVLTSGTPWGSGLGIADGVPRLRTLLAHRPPDLEIVLGGGVDATTIRRLLDRLPSQETGLSVHAYSSVLRDKITDARAVANLVQAVTQP